MFKVACVLGLVLLAGCTTSDLVDCGNGNVCPAGTTCHQLTDPDALYCATEDQVEDCEGVDDGATCGEDPAVLSYCVAGVCLPIVCGNDRIDLGETCDDGNTVTGDATCSGDCKSDETCGNGSVDPLRIVGSTTVLNERCDDGNKLSADGCSSICAIEDARWQAYGLTPPPASLGAGLAYDSARRRIVMFGGGFSNGNDKRGLAATYEWDGRAWLKIPITVTPGPRWAVAFAYDSRRHRHVMFGGQDILTNSAPIGFRETWEWDGSRWDLRAPLHAPVGRVGASMVFDSKRGVVVLFGGRTLDLLGDYLSDTWEWDGNDWRQVTTAAVPPARNVHAMGYDPKRGVVVMTGGEEAGFTARFDTWEYDGTNWNPTANTSISIRRTQLVYDTLNSRLMTYGGGSTTVAEQATLAYTGSAWIALNPLTVPGPRREPSLVSDPISGNIVMFGGATSTTTESAETWTWTGTNWSGPSASPAVPAAVSQATGAYDPTRATEWVFATDGSLWAFNGHSWRVSSATSPSAREDAMMAYDVARDELVLFGGVGAGAETWLYSIQGDEWRQATTVLSPPARAAAVMTYDPQRQRVVLHAGTMNPTTFLNDVWEWDGVAWSAKTPPAGPPPRAVGSSTYHPGVGMLVMNGYYTDANNDVILTSDLWSWDGSVWTDRVTVSPVASRGYGTVVYSGGLNRSVDFAGLRLGGRPFDDTWEFDGISWKQALVANPPPPRGAHISFPGRNGSDVMVFGGADGLSAPAFTDLWRYRYLNESPRELCTIDADNDGDNLAGCDDPDCWATCTPLCPPNTTCPANAPRCGDGSCSASLENCRICPEDCTCVAVCGDSFCDAVESASSCPGDCP